MRVTGMKQPGNHGETRRELDEDASLGANSFFFHDACDREHVIYGQDTQIFSRSGCTRTSGPTGS
eukprot:6191313-Pleurochrysis_carterae.AAC.1